jgi:glycosyltransferase involved in cell wall biosynthesis
MFLFINNFNFIFFFFVTTTILIWNLTEEQLISIEKGTENAFKQYLTESFKGNLLQPIEFVKSESPKISVIIPMHNEEKNVRKAIRPVQNQDLREIEIVVVNDNSNDNTLRLLKFLQKEDPRITILTNKITRGVLYSRIYGAIKSKGEYVTFVNPNDGYCTRDILSKAYKEATEEHEEDIDIVQFQSCGSGIDDKGIFEKFGIFYTFNPNTFNKVIREPYIGYNFMQGRRDVTGSTFVFDKIYRRSLALRTANYIAPEFWNQNLVYLGELLLCFGMMKSAKTLVSISDVGYWHLFEKNYSEDVLEIEPIELKNPEKSNIIIDGCITVVERILQLTEDEPESSEFREFILMKVGSDELLPAIARSFHFERYLYLIEKAYNWKYIKEKSKNKIKGFFNHVLSFEIGPKDKFSYLFKKN